MCDQQRLPGSVTKMLRLSVTESVTELSIGSSHRSSMRLNRTLQWRHMRVMASQTTYKQLCVRQLVHVHKKRKKIKAPITGPFVRGINRSSVVSPPKGPVIERRFHVVTPDSKINGANMGLTWVLSAPDGPQIGPIKLAIRDIIISRNTWMVSDVGDYFRMCAIPTRNRLIKRPMYMDNMVYPTILKYMHSWCEHLTL